MDEVDLPKPPIPKNGFTILSWKRILDRVAIRPVMRASLGPVYYGAVTPYPDTSDGVTGLYGECARAASRVPILVTGCRFPRGNPPLYSGWKPHATRRQHSVDPIMETAWSLFQLSDTKFEELKSIIDEELSELLVDVRDSTLECLWDFKKSVVALCQREFVPLSADYDYSVDSWLPKTGYRVCDKQRLLRTLERLPVVDVSSTDVEQLMVRACECFIKSESYSDVKQARPIKSRSDRWKCHVGPYFHAIGEVLFTHPYFVKKIPLPCRPEYMKTMFAGFDRLNCTDFSKFESHFIRCLMHVCEFVFYDYVIMCAPDRYAFMRDIDVVQAGIQIFKYPWFTTSFAATRASGEMCTSSGNGFSNFAIFNYLMQSFSAEKSVAVFEGDDSINASYPDVGIRTSDYEDLGWNCKFEQVDSFSTASFCGIVADEDDLVQVCDIKEALVNFGWTSKRYATSDDHVLRALLRAKGYSMLYQYSGCPVLQALALYALRVTCDFGIHRRLVRMLERQIVWSDAYTAQKFVELETIIKAWTPVQFDLGLGKLGLPVREPPIKTRALVQKLYSISIDEQIRVESILSAKTDFLPLDFGWDFPASWVLMWRYVLPYRESACVFTPNPGSIRLALDYISGVEYVTTRRQPRRVLKEPI